MATICQPCFVSLSFNVYAKVRIPLSPPVLERTKAKFRAYHSGRGSNEDTEDHGDRLCDRYRGQFLGRRAWLDAEIVATASAAGQFYSLPGGVRRCATVLAEGVAGGTQRQKLISLHAFPPFPFMPKNRVFYTGIPSATGTALSFRARSPPDSPATKCFSPLREQRLQPAFHE